MSRKDNFQYIPKLQVKELETNLIVAGNIPGKDKVTINK